MSAYRAYLLACCAVMLAPGMAAAQTAETGATNVSLDQAQANSSASGGEIVVTGSRLGRTSFNSPIPVNVVGQDRIQNLAVSNVAEALNQIPAFRPLTSPATQSFQVTQNIGGRSLDLRGLGSQRTLTLIDGRRTVPSSDTGTFDLNAIPSILIQRSEVVTGGASAAYGADAVAGVVNLIMDTRFKGLRGEASYSTSQRGDARRYYAAIKAGTEFAGGRGHLVVGAEYEKEGAILDFNERAWGRRNYSFVPNPFFSATPSASNGLPATIATSNALGVLNLGGLISVVHPLQGYQFNAAGNLVPFQFGDLFNRARPSTLMVGGDPSVALAYQTAGTPLIVPDWHVAALAHAEYELTDRITLSAEVSYSRVDGGPTIGTIPNDQSGAIRITRDNPYLTAQAAALMDSVGTTFLPITRVENELGYRSVETVNNTWRAFVGLKGSIGPSWKWDVYYDYGSTIGGMDLIGLKVTSRFNQAYDAVRVTAANVGTSGLAIGSIVCRTTLAAPTNGCVPINVMGIGTISAAGVAYVKQNGWQSREFKQHHAALNIHGDLFEAWAGKVSAAAGVEYRTNSSVGSTDAGSIAQIYSTNSTNVLPLIMQKVTEGYGEIGLPVFKDWVLGKGMSVNAAVRRTHYSLSGDATTWKAGANWDINDDLMVRVTQSSDIRAPSANELNPNTTTQILTQADPKLNIQYVIPSVAGGNPNLKLEKAKTFTAGVVIKPSWFNGFRVSVDYYDITVNDSIDTLSVPQSVALCRAGGGPSVCTIGTDASGNPDRILRVFATTQNVNQLKARGFEIVANYTTPFLKGRLNATINGNYVDALTTTLPDGTVKNFANVTGNITATALFGVPRWRTDMVLTYERPTWAITGQFQYIPPAFLNRDWIGPGEDGYSPYLANSVNNNRVSEAYYFNLNGRVKLWGEGKNRVEMFGSINNLLDRDPPGNLRYNGNPVYYDVVGRSFKIGVRANL